MRLALVILCFLATSPVFAAATPWQDIAPGARLRLITSDVRQPDGTTLVGLELRIPDSYKTYWRLPGETGIPTEFAIAGSSGVAGPVIKWPYPVAETSDGFRDYVYHGTTVLPVELQTTGDAPLLKAKVTMGVCSNVCVPVHASFSLPLSFATPDAAETLRLRQALALVPIPWTVSPAPFGAVTYDEAAHSLDIAGVDPAVEPQSVIASTPDPTVIFDAPQKSRDGHSLVLPLRGADGRANWLDKPVQLTFMTSEGSFEVTADVAAAHR